MSKGPGSSGVGGRYSASAIKDRVNTSLDRILAWRRTVDREAMEAWRNTPKTKKPVNTQSSNVQTKPKVKPKNSGQASILPKAAEVAGWLSVLGFGGAVIEEEKKKK